ncbi:peptidylprolyl isomerase [Pandoraea thiooxydans]|uniref:peptidylprolyl isomerase n=1 Tax=Pandoraea thiooxydans TaxID=445709 RepID=A0A0G3ESV5_9BURK|nr:peptidylprolyl isomerase [Pandoraea thiooxydans]AKJ70158.1 peptidylprolyl isomerase [Pandoraea thiooxydans]APR93602.1 peptidylprolyl isomerase [Pandoraea thiooxydans]
MPEINVSRGTELAVNGVVIDARAIAEESLAHADQPDPEQAARRALVVQELLKQKALEAGLLSEAAALDDAAIDRLLAMECAMPEPSDEECLRYYTANQKKFRSPDVAFVRHILFAVTANAAMTQVRARAEQTHRELAQHPERFEELAKTLSNCPSGQVGGNLGQLTRGESVPEFEAAVFDSERTGLLPGLVNTRYGFHIVVVERRVPGATLPFDTVREAVGQYLAAHVRHQSIRQYLSLLVSAAELRGIAFDVQAGPLLQ